MTSPSVRRQPSRDFSVEAYQQFEEKPRASGSSAIVVRSLGRITRAFMLRLLAAMHENRRKQAAAMIGGYGHLLIAEPRLQASSACTLAPACEATIPSLAADAAAGPAAARRRAQEIIARVLAGLEAAPR
jgi:hypothetical protein